MNFKDVFFIKPIDIPQKQELINFISEYVKNHDNLLPEKWRCTVSSSYELEHRYKFDFSELKEIIADLFKEYAMLRGLDRFSDPTVGDVWWNYYIGNNFQEKHDHLDDDFSGVVYLKLDKTVHLPTVFYNPLFNSRFHSFSEIPDVSYIPDVNENDCILFPSPIAHEVLAHNTAVPRITLSFNVNYYDIKPNYINYC